MKFNFTTFVKDIHSSFQNEISINEVDEILSLDEDSYTRDNPSSVGRGLKINKIQFSGQKSDGSLINYNQDFLSGVYIWIGISFKGKSSLFKIIKYALTGNNSIENDVKKWIKEIYLDFSLGEKRFTVYLNDEGKRLSSTLYNINYDKLQNLISKNEAHKYVEFKTNSLSEYESQIQDFFFKSFSF